MKRSIAENGIRDPIKCTTAFTVISGHQRLKIARELGMGTVPVQIIDVNEWEAERIANFLKEYWGVRDGGDRKSEGQNVQLKNLDDIGEFVGESRRTKLNDLILELQALVSEGKLGSIAGEQLAHLTEDNQRALLNVLGEEIERTTVAKAKKYRSVQYEDGEYEQKLRELQEAKERAEKEAEQARQSEQIALSKLEVEQNKEPKIIYKQDEEQLEKLNSQIGEMNTRLEQAC